MKKRWSSITINKGSVQHLEFLDDQKKQFLKQLLS